MGKNKGQGKSQKGKSAKKDKPFAVSAVKKNKTKTVASNLKKMNFRTKNSTEAADKGFKAVQTALVEAAKSPPTQSKPVVKSKPTPTAAPPDVEMAADQFAKL